MKDNYLEEIFEKLENNTTTIEEERKKLNIDRSTLRDRLKKYDNERYNKLQEKKREKANKNKEREQAFLKQREEAYNKNLELLEKIGIDRNKREKLFEKLSLNKHTKMTRFAFADKLLQIMILYTVGRNQEIKKGEEGYIRPNDVIQMILKYPKVMTNDVKRKIKTRCSQIDDFSWATRAKTNGIILKYPEIFDESYDRFTKQMIILSNFMILTDEGHNLDAREYVLKTKANQQLKTSPEKIYQRLQAYRDEKNSNIFTENEYWKAIRESSKDEINAQIYPLPEYSKERKEEFSRKIKANILKNEDLRLEEVEER